MTLRAIVVTGGQRVARDYVIAQPELVDSLATAHWTRRTIERYLHRPSPVAAAAAKMAPKSRTIRPARRR